MRSSAAKGDTAGVPPTLHEVETRAMHGSAWGVINTIVGLPLTILATVILARQLGVVGFGHYALYGFIVPTVVALSDAGLDGGLAQRGAVAYGRGDEQELGRLAGQSFGWALARWPLLGVGLSYYLSDRIATVMLMVATICSVLSAGTGLRLLSTIRNAELSRVRLIAAAASALTAITFALADAPASRVFAAGLAAQSAVTMLQGLYLRSDRPALKACFIPRSLVGARRDFAFGGTSYLAGQLAGLTLSRSELLFFTPLQAHARGVYAGAYSIGSRLTLPLDAMYGSLGASLAAVRDDANARGRAANRLFRLSGSVFGVAAGPGLIFALLASGLLFPESYRGIATAAILLASASLAVSAASPILALYYSQRQMKPILIGAAVALVTNMSLSALLIPPFGLPGAVVANAGASVIYVVGVSIPMLRGELGGTLRTYARTVSASLAAATIIALGISAVPLLPLRLGLAALLGVVQPLIVLRTLPSIDASDLHALRSRLPERLRPALAMAERRLIATHR